MIRLSKQSASTSWQCNTSGNHHQPATYGDKGLKRLSHSGRGSQQLLLLIPDRSDAWLWSWQNIFWVYLHTFIITSMLRYNRNNIFVHVVSIHHVIVSFVTFREQRFTSARCTCIHIITHTNTRSGIHCLAAGGWSLQLAFPQLKATTGGLWPNFLPDWWP